MTTNEKEQPAKIFCLFHEKIDCVCIAPVTDNEKLKDRLLHQIRLNEIFNKHETDLQKKAERESQSAEFQTRLDALSN